MNLNIKTFILLPFLPWIFTILPQENFEKDVLSGPNARVLPVCTRMYPYVTGMFLVCTRIYPYVIGTYVTRMLLVCTRMYLCGVLVTIITKLKNINKGVTSCRQLVPNLLTACNKPCEHKFLATCLHTCHKLWDFYVCSCYFPFLPWKGNGFQLLPFQNASFQYNIKKRNIKNTEAKSSKYLEKGKNYSISTVGNNFGENIGVLSTD